MIISQGVHPKRRVYKMVLTGGPCGGKTTGQAELVGIHGFNQFKMMVTRNLGEVV